MNDTDGLNLNRGPGAYGHERLSVQREGHRVVAAGTACREGVMTGLTFEPGNTDTRRLLTALCCYRFDPDFGAAHA